uniref:Mannosyltransferase n=1 Tax=Fopius arisanus TaxID=64838 RepID=A0A0C9R2P7_9HYME
MFLTSTGNPWKSLTSSPLDMVTSRGNGITTSGATFIPFFISILYRILAAFGMDSPGALTHAPRVLHALLSAFADYRFYSWTRSTWSTFVLSLNWFWCYNATRTLTNTLETALTTIALTIFPWDRNVSSKTGESNYLWIVGFTCAIRPTMAITWMPLCTYHILTTSRHPLKTLLQYAIVALMTLTYSILIDTYCYGHFVFTQWEFFKANILNNIAGFYGTHSIHWYLTSALPVLLGVYVLYLPIATYQILKNYKINSREFILLFTILWTISVYSLLEHKEFRFILPILPMAIYICTCTKIPRALEPSRNVKKILICIFLVTNLIPLSYFSFVHQRGPLDVMRVLRIELARYQGGYQELGVDVMFLTPCHALPLYSHLHRNVTTRFLGCEPNFGGGEGLDETEEFFQDPGGWVQREFGGGRGGQLPAFVVLFDNIEERIAGFLRSYRIIAKRFHAHSSQGNYGNYILVYRHYLVGN